MNPWLWMFVGAMLFIIMIVLSALVWHFVDEVVAVPMKELIARSSRFDGVRALRPKPGMPEDPLHVSLVPSEEGEVALQSSQPGAFRAKQGTPLPVRAAWGELPYEELAPMFLDQFLLRYFPTLMESDGPFFVNVHLGNAPWKAFVAGFPWAADMPLLFEQLTGYKLNDRQLNEAIGEYISRLEKSQRAATPGQRETQPTG